jgi:dipeptidyl aminopeptidase/acylaminoacyl peptidase
MATSFPELLQTKSALLADADRDPRAPERLLVRSDLTGTMQLYELCPPEPLRQVTALDEPVGSAFYLPGARRAAIEVDRGGNERHQLYLIDLDIATKRPAGFEDLTALTDDPGHGHHIAGISPNGRVVAYLSNKANGVDFDLWTCDLDTGEHRLAYAGGSWLQPSSGFSPDGRWISVERPGPLALDTDLLLVEPGTLEAKLVLAHGDEGAQVGAPAWTSPTVFYVSSNVGSDHARVVRYDLETDESSVLDGSAEAWDAAPVTGSDGSTLAVVENRNGASAIWIADPEHPETRAEVPLPEPGVVTSHLIRMPIVSADGSHVYYTLSSPRLAGDVWAYDTSTGTTRRLTVSPAPVAAEGLVGAGTAQVESFDGERIPLFTYRPQSEHQSARQSGPANPPVVVLIHGGPESQSVLSFNPVIQGLVGAGFAVVVPNVRGSTGYGKRYASLDDTTRRLDSVRDLAAVHGWLGDNGFDADRAALWGGSYGGYMVLAGLAFQPELWAAGVDIVGISDLVTFLENTSDYRRAHREREYGSLAHDRAFLASASPLRRADDIRAPLFVIHGRNDPRVPVGEAEQLTKSLVGRGVRCDLLIYEDEGHGLARLANRLDAYPRALEFLAEVLGV